MAQCQEDQEYSEHENMIRNVIRSIGISALLLSSVNLFAQYRRDTPPPNDQGNYEGNANSVNAGGN